MSSSFVLEMSGITKSFPGVLALDDVALSVVRGEIHGLVGENGAGKSTIIKILAGVYVADHGSVAIDGQVLSTTSASGVFARGVRFVHQELNLVPHFTVVESMFMGQEISGLFGLRLRDMKNRAREILKNALGVDINPGALIRDLSPAERKLVQIARALVIEGGKLIVFDEPTAPLASTEVDKVLGAIRRLKDQGISVIYVSHYLAEIAELCDRVTVLRNGVNAGSLDALGPGSVPDLIRMIVGRELADLFPSGSADQGDDVLVLKNLGDRRRFADISLSVRQGEIVGLAGVLGAGCEEIVDAVMGLRAIKDGAVFIGGKKVRLRSPAAALKRGMVLIPRDRRNDGLVLNMSLAQNITLSTLSDVATGGMISHTKSLLRAQQMIESLDIRPGDPHRKARFLSGGNQQKVVLGRSLAAKAKIFIFDEPTVGVDVGAKSEIYRIIRDLATSGAGVLVSSNEPAELLGLCDRVLVVVRGRIVAERPSGQWSRDELVEEMTGGGAS